MNELATTIIDDPDNTTDVPEIDPHQQAFDFDPHWQGKPLEAYTLARQSLVAELEAARIGPTSRADTAAFMPGIWAVLWVCLHPRELWRTLRSNPAIFWETIEDWAEVNCPQALWPEAITLVNGEHVRQPDGTFKMIKMGIKDAVAANVVAVRHRPGPGMVGNVPRQ